ncbi:MAG: response regulator transcription factor [Nitrospira sp.]|nr:response regulator transcription factor [Nitrospira sp.]
MVLLEKIIGKHQTDFKKAQKDFGLTKRETEVMCLLCEGYSNKNISDELFIGEYTVKDHIKNIMRKMNVTSRSGIIAGLK